MLSASPSAILRQAAVRDAFRHAWAGYRAVAWGRDGLRPVSRSGHDELLGGGMAATLVDALDTLLVMGLAEEYLEVGAD